MSDADLPCWDLSDLYRGTDDPEIAADLEKALKDAEGFEAQYRGKIVAEETGAKGLCEAIYALEAIRELGDKVISYASLVFSADTNDPKNGALLQMAQERLTEINTHLLFFDLEWAAAPEALAAEWMKAHSLAEHRHFLEEIRKFGPHQLSEAEEKILDEKANTGIRAFQRLFDEAINLIRFKVEVRGETKSLTEQEVLALLHDRRRSTRRAAAFGLTEGLKEHAPVLTFILNQVTADHASDDRLRRFPDPMASRNLSNEIDSKAVDALLSSCEEYFFLVGRYYELKKKVLGLETLYDYDRYAPLSLVTEAVPFDQGRETVLSAFHDFSPRVEELAALFFENRWIDAAVRPGKRGGAFSHSTVPSVHPYVFVNYLGTPRDVMTLAHELGHGVHQWLSRQQRYFNTSTPLTTAETASVFAEMLVFHRLKKSEKDPEKRLALIMSKLEEDFATVFRQVILCRFEQIVHAARRNEGELSTERVNELWMAANQEMFKGSVTLTDDYSCWWMYIPHFIHSPFYTYAYAFGHLLVLSLFQKYIEEGKKFVPKYLNLLSAGGSVRPDLLLQEKMNLNITDPLFWRRGLGLLERMLGEAERLAGKR
ncbi:MAG: M3 family oligoendopeptidase [Nitrospiria bacterium]